MPMIGTHIIMLTIIEATSGYQLTSHPQPQESILSSHFHKHLQQEKLQNETQQNLLRVKTKHQKRGSTKFAKCTFHRVTVFSSYLTTTSYEISAKEEEMVGAPSLRQSLLHHLMRLGRGRRWRCKSMKFGHCFQVYIPKNAKSRETTIGNCIERYC